MYDSAAAADDCHDSLVYETAPPGINLFSVLNLPNPPNVTDLQDWRVILSKESSYMQMNQTLEVSKMISKTHNRLGQWWPSG